MDTAVAGLRSNASADSGWLERLVASGTPADIAAVLLRLARARAECTVASVLWWESGEACPSVGMRMGARRRRSDADAALPGYRAADVDDEALAALPMRMAAPALAAR